MCPVARLKSTLREELEERIRDEQLERLRTNVQAGFEQIDRGKATDYRGTDSRNWRPT